MIKMCYANLNNTFVHGAFGTSALTLYSSLASAGSKDVLCVPELLALFIRETVPLNRRVHYRTAGWLLHYAIGIGWATCYRYLYLNRRYDPDLKGLAVLGAVSGMVAVGCWQLMFRLHPQPPATRPRLFLLHLFAGHLAYSVAITAMIRQARSSGS